MKKAIGALVVSVVATIVIGCGTDVPADDGSESQSAALRPRNEDGPPEFYCDGPAGPNCSYQMAAGHCTTVCWDATSGSFYTSTYNPCPYWAAHYTCTWYGSCQCY